MSVQFETPENVTISYEPAGLGSRFLAWMIDWLLLLIPFAMIVIIALADKSGVVERTVKKETSDLSMQQIIFVISTISMLLWGILSFVYFGMFELMMSGQTPGKRIMKLRVVKTGGFALDAASIAVRSIFRVIDNFPPLWIFVFVSKQAQRLGDLVAGTIVVFDAPPDSALQDLRETLLKQSDREAQHHFNAAVMKRCPPETSAAAERILLYWNEMTISQKTRFLEEFCHKLAARHQLPMPDLETGQRFLEDYLLAEYRQQYRQLG